MTLPQIPQLSTSLGSLGVSLRRPTGWWLTGGVDPSDVIAAYQPKGAISLAESYLNLANPGTYNAIPIVAPGWTAADGWIFSGSHYLDTGITANICQSVVIYLTNILYGNQIIFGGLSSALNGIRIFLLTTPRIQFVNGGGYEHPEVFSGGTLGIAGKTAYRNGLPVGTIGGGAQTGTVTMYIGRQNGLSGYYLSGRIKAVAFYKNVLSADQVAGIHAEMLAL